MKLFFIVAWKKSRERTKYFLLTCGVYSVFKPFLTLTLTGDQLVLLVVSFFWVCRDFSPVDVAYPASIFFLSDKKLIKAQDVNLPEFI